MATSPPHTTIPISNPPQPSSQITTPAFRAFLSRFTDSARRAFSQRRPWLELVDRSAFTRPDSLTEATSRVRKNFSYFRINYLTLLSAVLALSLITHPGSFFILAALLAAWIFLYLFRPADSPIILFGRTFSNRETLGILVVISVIAVFLTSVGSVLMSALLVGLGIVCVHGAFRVPEDLFLDDQEPAGAGFLSFLGGAASSAAVAAAPAVVSRV